VNDTVASTIAPALIAGHLSLHEAPAVAHAPHAVLDRNLWIAGKQEVDVDRVTRAVLHRACGRGQHLGEQLAAEDPGPKILDAARLEAIIAERFGVERVEQRLERAGHLRARHRPGAPTLAQATRSTSTAAVRNSSAAAKAACRYLASISTPALSFTASPSRSSRSAIATCSRTALRTARFTLAFVTVIRPSLPTVISARNNTTLTALPKTIQ
jgi:hypothetical protein